jgi:hypothetical protein
VIHPHYPLSFFYIFFAKVDARHQNNGNAKTKQGSKTHTKKDSTHEQVVKRRVNKNMLSEKEIYRREVLKRARG